MATYIIAEAGVNHNGSLAMALDLVDAAARAGADAVKFQTFTAASLVSPSAPKADYQKRTTDGPETQYEMLRRLELSEADHDALIARCRERGITFLATPFDSASLALLCGRFGLDTIKVSSGDLTNAPFLLEIGRAARRVILSTGMSALAEVEEALGVLAFAYASAPGAPPGPAAFAAAYASPAGQAALHGAVTLLHCTTEYPAPIGEVNLRAMDTLSAAFGLPVGYSDHTEGIHVPVAAVARGAGLIEKHFTLDKTLPGPDHRASLEPSELVAMVAAVRDIEVALGDGIKRPTPAEVGNRVAARKSLVAAMPLASGQPLMLAVKRPGNGVSPFRYWALQGRPASRDYQTDELIDDDR
ncbi:MAG: N-acetylneuraminate synthase [Rhodocyclaceae bacterium]|nr:MAG: N-acetylneuraminate synthase [Rhodocyclaceae bacterium]